MDPFIITYTGKKVYPLEVKDDDLDILDIAHSLSNKCRFTGHTSSFYSVAEHCVLMSRNAPDGLKLQALLHDAAEAYLPDVATPIKDKFPLILEAEKRILHCVRNKFFHLQEWNWEEIKKLDSSMLRLEARRLMPMFREFSFEVEPQDLNLNLPCWFPVRAKSDFMTLFNKMVY